MEHGFADPGVVRNAILTLMAQSPGHHDANAFLIAFEGADAAWQVLLHVVQKALQGLAAASAQAQQQPQQGTQPPTASSLAAQQHEQVAFFASNLLHSKVCKYWKAVR
jgi:hypothetical protein